MYVSVIAAARALPATSNAIPAINPAAEPLSFLCPPLRSAQAFLCSSTYPKQPIMLRDSETPAQEKIVPGLA